MNLPAGHTSEQSMLNIQNTIEEKTDFIAAFYMMQAAR